MRINNDHNFSCKLGIVKQSQKSFLYSNFSCDGDRRKHWLSSAKLCGVAVHKRHQSMFPPQPPGGQEASLPKRQHCLWW